MLGVKGGYCGYIDDYSRLNLQMSLFEKLKTNKTPFNFLRIKQQWNAILRL